MDDTGNAHTDHASMAAMATSYFSNLFSADASLCADPVIDLINTHVTNHMNDGLCADFAEKEIAHALFQIGPLKSPGPDGFPVRFYQRNWDVLKEEVVGSVKQFFTDGAIPSELNTTTIVLIPKTNQAVELKYLRSISLCNVIYKVVSKCIVSRLSPLLDELIGIEQSAFIPRRLISETLLSCLNASMTSKGGETQH